MDKKKSWIHEIDVDSHGLVAFNRGVCDNGGAVFPYNFDNFQTTIK